MSKLPINPGANAVEGTMESTAYIGLGSNLGSRDAGLESRGPADAVEAAILHLGALGTLLARSSLYATEPVGNLRQPPFVNAVVALRTELTPMDLLNWLLRIEREFGRDRAATPAKGPRTLDLDILLMEELAMETNELTVPHPAMAERRFVLAPLAEIAPGLVHPRLRKTIAELLAALPDAGQNRIAAVHRMSNTGSLLTVSKGRYHDPIIH